MLYKSIGVAEVGEWADVSGDRVPVSDPGNVGIAAAEWLAHGVNVVAEPA